MEFLLQGVYEMKDILRPILELSVVLPGLLLAYFPVKSYLKQSPWKACRPDSPPDGRIMYRWWDRLLSAACFHCVCPGRDHIACNWAIYRNAQNLPLEIRNNCTDCLRSICMHQQLVSSYQCYDCSAYAAATGRTVVLPCSLCIFIMLFAGFWC